MKHFAVVLLLLVLISLFSISAFAETAPAPVDLSNMSLDDLVSLKDQLNLAIWNSKDWKEVTVPQGIWEVGKDIPAGHWTIKAADGAFSTVNWGNELNEHKTDVDPNSYIAGAFLVSMSSPSYDKNSDQTQVDFELTTNTYVGIVMGSVIFTPYDGKPAFTFN